MNKLYQIYYIGKSDFIDRIRSKSILIITLLMVYISYLFFPENNSSLYYTLNYFNNGFFYRGIYNSTWLGWVSTIAFISVVSLIGFYFVRNSITREKELLIGEITASTELKSWIFIFGKAFGNFMFLLLQMFVVILITIIMQFVRGESYFLDPIKLLTPFLILAVPTCFIVAVIAIIFDTIPFFTGTFGNIAYFFMWTGVIVASVQERAYSLSDVFGMNTTGRIVLEQLKSRFKEFKNMDSFSLGVSEALHGNVKTFVMDKVNISASVLFERVFWILIGILLLFLVAAFFKRTSLIKTKSAGKAKDTKRNKEYNHQNRVVLSPVFENKTYSNNFFIIESKLKIMLALPNLWWYGIVIICSVGVLFAQGDNLYKFLIPAIWILPIFIWSKLGTIEKNFHMEDYLLTYKNYRNTEILNSVTAGIIFTIVINISVIIKFLMLGNLIGVLYVFMAVFFVNALGIFIGSFFASSTAFEIIYIILWYVGVLNGLSSLDFIGLTRNAACTYIPVVFFLIGIALVIMSIIIKNKRMVLTWS